MVIRMNERHIFEVTEEELVRLITPVLKNGLIDLECAGCIAIADDWRNTPGLSAACEKVGYDIMNRVIDFAKCYMED